MIRREDATIVDRREMLKVKVKSLTAEAHIIHREEQRTRGDLRAELRWHREHDLRYEARATYLAYGLIKGRQVTQVEHPNTKRDETLWVKVRKMIERYGPTDKAQNTQLLERCNG